MATIPEKLAAALKLHQAGEIQAAEKGYRQVLRISPNQPDALHLLGVIAQQVGCHDKAIKCISQAIAANPKVAAFHGNLGAAYDSSGRFDEAIASYHRAIELSPTHPDAHYNLGITLRQLEKLDEAVDCFRRAIELNPDFGGAHNNLGATLAKQGRFSAAETALLRALELTPDHAEVHRNLGSLYCEQGKHDAAAAHLERAVELNPGYASARAGLAHMKRHSEADRDEIGRLEEALSDKQLPPRDACSIHFALGKMYDDIGQWDDAFKHYREANQLADWQFDRESVVRKADLLIKTFTPALFSAKANLGRRSDLPVFVVGMLRSATTLVEQILASHRSVFGAGELPEFGDVVWAIQSEFASGDRYPSCLPLITGDCVETLADRYLGHLRQLDGQATRIVDKMPTNFWHLGLIAMFLPGAKIVHCKRHPLDVCLSCYFQPFSSRVDFACDLTNLGTYYRQYERLMAHWRTVLPLEVLDVEYEDLVGDQEAVTRRLLDFCGLDWDPNCLKFHANKRVVRTASHWQVRQPIYTRSVDRWRHYEEHLGPLKEALGWAS